MRSLVALLPWLVVTLVPAQTPNARAKDLLAPSSSALRPLLERFVSDWQSLERSETVSMSEARRDRFRAMVAEWKAILAAVPFDELEVEGRIDYHLLMADLEFRGRKLDHDAARDEEIQGLVPFRRLVIDLCEARRRIEPVDPAKAAAAMVDLTREVTAAEATLSEAKDVKRSVAQRAVDRLGELGRLLDEWFRFRAGYDPLFSWWVEVPHGEAKAALDHYVALVRKHLVGEDGSDAGDIVGDPIGREALLLELRTAFVPYTPEELVEIARREYAWCLTEMLRASRDLGFGESWRKALAHVKGLHVAPGEQPALIKMLAAEAVDFLDARDLVTIPELCRETWRMNMMTPERQRVNPYFTGGEVISVSFPTQSMKHDDKLMSLRGNNVHFSRATVHHELIPGHHLQGFMTSRYSTWRQPFSTPFWLEGWALYWEMRLWDLGFPKSAEDRVGMLFWRMHRCARIVFSLSFHLGAMSPKECVAYLVEHVGHEPRNAAAEVRRSVQGGYEPLYQCAYMLGGLQLRTVWNELVQGGRMTERTFHDTVLRGGPMPIELVRASLTRERLARDFKSVWRFYPLD